MCRTRYVASVTQLIAQTSYTPTATTILKYFGLTSLTDELLAEDGTHNLEDLLAQD